MNNRAASDITKSKADLKEFKRTISAFLSQNNLHAAYYWLNKLVPSRNQPLEFQKRVVSSNTTEYVPDWSLIKYIHTTSHTSLSYKEHPNKEMLNIFSDVARAFLKNGSFSFYIKTMELFFSKFYSVSLPFNLRDVLDHIANSEYRERYSCKTISFSQINKLNELGKKEAKTHAINERGDGNGYWSDRDTHRSCTNYYDWLNLEKQIDLNLYFNWTPKILSNPAYTQALYTAEPAQAVTAFMGLLDNPDCKGFAQLGLAKSYCLYMEKHKDFTYIDKVIRCYADIIEKQYGLFNDDPLSRHEIAKNLHWVSTVDSSKKEIIAKLLLNQIQQEAQSKFPCLAMIKIFINIIQEMDLHNSTPIISQVVEFYAAYSRQEHFADYPHLRNDFITDIVALLKVTQNSECRSKIFPLLLKQFTFELQCEPAQLRRDLFDAILENKSLLLDSANDYIVSLYSCYQKNIRDTDLSNRILNKIIQICQAADAKQNLEIREKLIQCSSEYQYSERYVSRIYDESGPEEQKNLLPHMAKALGKIYKKCDSRDKPSILAKMTQLLKTAHFVDRPLVLRMSLDCLLDYPSHFVKYEYPPFRFSEMVNACCENAKTEDVLGVIKAFEALHNQYAQESWLVDRIISLSKIANPAEKKEIFQIILNGLEKSETRYATTQLIDQLLIAEKDFLPAIMKMLAEKLNVVTNNEELQFVINRLQKCYFESIPDSEIYLFIKNALENQLKKCSDLNFKIKCLEELYQNAKPNDAIFFKKLLFDSLKLSSEVTHVGKACDFASELDPKGAGDLYAKLAVLTNDKGCYLKAANAGNLASLLKLAHLAEAENINEAIDFYKRAMQCASESNDAEKILAALEQIFQFVTKYSGVFKDEQSALVKIIILFAYQKLSDSEFLNHSPKFLNELFQLTKQYIPKILTNTLQLPEVFEMLKSYFKYNEEFNVLATRYFSQPIFSTSHWVDKFSLKEINAFKKQIDTCIYNSTLTPSAVIDNVLGLLQEPRIGNTTTSTVCAYAKQKLSAYLSKALVEKKVTVQDLELLFKLQNTHLTALMDALITKIESCLAQKKSDPWHRSLYLNLCLLMMEHQIKVDNLERIEKCIIDLRCEIYLDARSTDKVRKEQLKALNDLNYVGDKSQAYYSELNQAYAKIFQTNKHLTEMASSNYLPAIAKLTKKHINCFFPNMSACLYLSATLLLLREKCNLSKEGPEAKLINDAIVEANGLFSRLCMDSEHPYHKLAQWYYLKITQAKGQSDKFAICPPVYLWCDLATKEIHAEVQNGMKVALGYDKTETYAWEEWLTFLTKVFSAQQQRKNIAEVQASTLEVKPQCIQTSTLVAQNQLDLMSHAKNPVTLFGHNTTSNLESKAADAQHLVRMMS